MGFPSCRKLLGESSPSSRANQNLFRKFDGALPLPVMKNSKTVPVSVNMGGLDLEQLQQHGVLVSSLVSWLVG